VFTVRVVVGRERLEGLHEAKQHGSIFRVESPDAGRKHGLSAENLAAAKPVIEAADVLGVGRNLHSGSPVVIRPRSPRCSGEFEAGRSERPGKEASPQGPSGRRVDALPGRAALRACTPKPAGRMVMT
jgi:hypothetical protein